MSSVLKLSLILLAAAVLAMGARVAFVNSNAAPAPVEPDPRVLIAAADLPAGLLLREGDLSWQAMPRSEIPDGALREGSVQATVTGSLLRHRLTAGSLLRVADLIRPDAPGFLAAALKPGMRAVSVPVDDVSGNAGLIQPGDYVDMILTQRIGHRGDMGGSETPRVVSETVVERARVIAVGSSFSRESELPKSNRARTVTIEVNPRTAEAVTVAAEIGTLSMALRSFAVADRQDAQAGAESTGATVVAWEGGQQAQAHGPVWGSDVSRVLDRPSAADKLEPKPEIPRRITVMRGNEKQEQELSTYGR